MTQLPAIPKAEAQVNDVHIRKFGADLVDKRHQMASDLALVHKLKPKLDAMMQPIANQTGTTMQSRVKDAKQIVRKVILQRSSGKKYELSDLNDLMGFRFVFTNSKQEKQVLDLIHQYAKRGKFTILKEEHIEKENFESNQIDIAFPLSGTKAIRGEIQVLSSKDSAQAALGHDAYFKHGDDLPSKDQKRIDKQTKQVAQLPPIKQQVVEQTMLKAHKITKDKPLPQGFGGRVIAQIKKS